MKFFIAVLAFCLSSLYSVAQIPKGMGKSDAEAKVILDAVSTKFRGYKSIQANFQLKIENGAGKNMGNKTGVVSMKGIKYQVSLTGQNIFSDGTTIWNYDQSSNEVTINKFDPTANSITPQKLFTNFYDKDFLYKLNGVIKIGGKNMQEIELTPVDKTKPFFKVLLYVDKATIFTTKVFEKNGNRFTYSISNMKTNIAISDNSFVFDVKKYPGVEVVDLR